MNVVKSTTIVADELNEINSLIDLRARKLRVKERALKDKIKTFKLWEKNAYEALRHHAETLMCHAILRIKNVVEKHAAQAKTVLDTSESVMNLCNQQKTQIQKLSHAVKEPQRLLKVYKSRLDAERRRGKFLRRRVTQIEKENNRLRDMCHYEAFCKETERNATATCKHDSSDNKDKMNPSFHSTDNVYKTQNFSSQRFESSPPMTPKQCQVMCKNHSNFNYEALLQVETKINKRLLPTQSSNCHSAIPYYKCTESGHQSPVLKDALVLDGNCSSFSSREKTTKFHTKNTHTYERLHQNQNNIDITHVFPKVFNFSVNNPNLNSLHEEQPWQNLGEGKYEKRLFMPGHLNLIKNNLSITTKRQNEQREGLNAITKNKVKQKNTSMAHTSQQVLPDSQTFLSQSTHLRKNSVSKQNVDLWTIKKVPGLPFQSNFIRSMEDFKKQYTKSFELSRKKSSLHQPSVQYHTIKGNSSQLRSVTVPPAVSSSKPKRNSVNSLSIPPTINVLRNSRMFTMLPQIDSDRQIVESATMLQKLAHRIKIKKMLQSVKL